MEDTVQVIPERDRLVVNYARYLYAVASQFQQGNYTETVGMRLLTGTLNDLGQAYPNTFDNVDLNRFMHLLVIGPETTNVMPLVTPVLDIVRRVCNTSPYFAHRLAEVYDVIKL